ncbi:4Fe-4S dicluster domain-containing protein [Candidatus Sumerlaeota bacterium]|nr:4Fe-4S dicluster domain-containing protein [Candidatus Sumerlaeota bacterium]
MKPVAILTDVTRCTGCEKCVAACKREYDLGPDRPWRQKGAIDDLSSTRLTTILNRPGGHHVRKHCRHCDDPACVSACLVGAMQKTPEGPVIYNPKKCMGCRYCMMACPYGIPRYDWNRPVPYIRKCPMCYDRIQAGGQPACTEICPEKATIFGSREELLALAHERIKAEPTKYLQHVYGETEVGGMSVLYISDIPLDFLSGKSVLSETPLPELTYAALSKAPGTVVAAAGLLTGVYWLIGRRMRLQELEAAAAERTHREVPADESKKTREADE